ncbi:MAG: hypothetical protein IJI25_08885 [Eubacterium sp.]|nr:hypothetical protein [Eubacterium sp.]
MKIGKEIKETWTELKNMIADGSFSYQPGDFKMVDLGEDGIIRMRLAGSEVDRDKDGFVIPTTWIAGDLTAKRHRMHNDWFGEYSKSDLRKWLNEVLFERLPDDLKEIIVPALKRQVAYDPEWNCYTDEVADRLWIPSFAELFEGGYPDLFSDNESRAMGQFYWCRSANSFNSFFGVYSTGTNYYTTANTSSALPVGFSF